MKRFLTAAAVSAATVLAVSCAKERTANTNEAAKRYFDAWVTVQKEAHPEYLWEKTGNGVYLLLRTSGTVKERACCAYGGSPYT